MGGSIISYVNIFTFILQCLFDVMPAAVQFSVYSIQKSITLDIWYKGLSFFWFGFAFVWYFLASYVPEKIC